MYKQKRQGGVTNLANLNGEEEDPRKGREGKGREGKGKEGREEGRKEGRKARSKKGGRKDKRMRVLTGLCCANHVPPSVQTHPIPN